MFSSQNPAGAASLQFTFPDKNQTNNKTSDVKSILLKSEL